MALSTITETSWNGPELPTVSHPNANQIKRLMAVFGLTAAGVPKVDEDTLARYYTYLSANLSLPFATYYPQPNSSLEEVQFRCMVLDLLDPTKHLGDEFDGIYGKTRKGKYEINLPLIELYVPEDSPNMQLIEDYCYWFWNWR